MIIKKISNISKQKCIIKINSIYLERKIKLIFKHNCIINKLNIKKAH